MYRRLAFALALLLAVPSVASAVDYYVYGNFCTTCSGAPNAAQKMFDDGLHGDGVANDNIYGAYIVSDKPAGHYTWTIDGTFQGFGPFAPICGCRTPPAGTAHLYTTSAGETIHFVRGLVSVPGWGGQYVASDHGVPTGVPMEVVVLDPTISNFYADSRHPAYPAQKFGSIWSSVVNIGSGPSDRQFEFRANGDLFFTESYNAACGCFAGEQPLVQYPPVAPNTFVEFQFDENTGLMRGIDLGPTPARTASWGKLKTLYR